MKKKTSNYLRQTVAISLVKNMGPVSFQKLLQHFGNPDAILKAPKNLFSKINGLAKISHSELVSSKLLDAADLEIQKAIKGQTQILTIFDDGYPADLKNIYDPPMLLYVKGDMPAAIKPKIAVVGSRLASPYGERMARDIARDLSQAGAVVVSGMARGVDSAAHEGALLGRGPTLAVLGGGISKIYPAQNKSLAERITEQGALISEYPMDMLPKPQYFPVRNRIISGLSLGVLVVEAGEKSGALITVDAALEQGKEVFALPGNADSRRSAGTNALLKEGAKLVTSANDILAELQLSISPIEAAAVDDEASSPDKNATAPEKKILNLLNSEATHVDDIVAQSGLGTKEAISALSMLEIRGRIKQLPGKHFILSSRSS